MSFDDQELIYRYLNGSLSKSQIQIFEQRMMDDSFADDFINFVNDEEIIQRALSEIKTKRPKRKPVKSFVSTAYKFAVAAALIVVGFIFYEMNNYEANLNVFKGQVSINRGTEKVSLEKNVKIKIGDVIETAEGTCTFKYKDKTTVRVEPFSRVKINVQKGAKYIQLLSGSVHANVKPQDKNQAMVVRSVPGTAKVLGTRFTATAISTAMKLDVIKGAVLLKNNTGQEAIVRSGEYAIARDNVPVEVLKTPVQDEIKEDEEKFYKWNSYSTKLRNDKDLVAYYDFQGVAADSTTLLNKSVSTRKNQVNGKITNAVPVQGRWIHKEALYFTGKSFVDCGNHSSFNITDKITVFAWVKSLEFQSYQTTFLSKGDTSWRLARYRKTSSIEMAGSGLSPKQWAIANEKIDDGKWHLLCGVYDGSKISVYIDGELQKSENTKGKININDMKVSIGTNLDHNDRFFTGWIDEAGIFKRALSAQELKNMYIQGMP